MADEAGPIRVLEVAGSMAGRVAAKLFADIGADVTRLERAGPVSTARTDAGDVSSVDALGHRDALSDLDALGDLEALGDPDALAYLDVGKRVRVIDAVDPLPSVDVLIESAAPGPLRRLPRGLGGECPIRVSISPLGSGGPLSGMRSNDFTDEALAGHLLLNGAPEREPIARPGRLSSYQAGLAGFIGALAALRVRDATGRAEDVDVSHLEGLVAMHQHSITMWTHDRHVLRRAGNRQPGYWHPAGVYACRDGHVVLNVTGQAARDRLLAATDLAEALLDPRFSDDLAVARHKDAFDALLAPWLSERTADEIVSVLQSAHVPAAAVVGPSAVAGDRQLVARGALVTWRGLSVPRAPFTTTVAPASPGRARGARDATNASHPSHAAASGTLPLPAPLAGIRVLDLGRVWAGPLAGRMLADLGADVVAVEAPDARGGRTTPDGLADITHLFADGDTGADPWNRIGSTNALLRGKRGVTLDLQRSEARDIFTRLVARADVIVENFAPGFLPGIGLGFEALRTLNPGIVVASITGLGADGPDAAHVAFGPTIEARAGTTHGIGYADSDPFRSGIAWPDPVAALHAVAGILAALRDRSADSAPRARHIEVSMLESTLCAVTDAWISAQRDGADPPRHGTRHQERAPQGVYPCAGRDRWIALSVSTDGEWRALCGALDLDSSFAGFGAPERRARHDAIDMAIAARTASEDRFALARRLQDAGVPAFWLSDARDLYESEHLAAHGLFVVAQEAGAAGATRPERRETGLPFRLGAGSRRPPRPAPRLGEHNREVLHEWLGLGDAALTELEATGVLVDAPPTEHPAPVGRRSRVG